MKLYVLFFLCMAIIASATVVKRPTTAYPDYDFYEKVSITVYYKSHCLECGNFFMSQLQPIYCKVKEYVNLKFVPINNFNKSKGSICTEDTNECYGNMVQNCVLSRINDPIAQLDYVTCATSDLEWPRYIEDMCLSKHNLTADEIKTCVFSQEGQKLLFRAELKKKEINTRKLSFPTIVLDDSYSDFNQWLSLSDLEVMVCKQIENHGYEDICSNGVILSHKRCARTQITRYRNKYARGSVRSGLV